MNKLVTQPNIEDPDGFYAELLEIHGENDKKTSDSINAQLILIMANHIGDRDVLRQALALAAPVKSQ